jgi:hypothetical protein
LQAGTFAGANIPARRTGSADTEGPEGSSSRSVANIAGVLARFEKEVAANTNEMRIATTMDLVAMANSRWFPD